MSTELITRTAILSDDGTYRYRLTRTWDDQPPLVFCMLNPSTADATTDDPTIRRCMGFARRENAGGIVIVNLFALRATNPAELLTHPHPEGPDNYRHISEVVDRHPLVAAWGAHPMARREGNRVAWAIGADPFARILCLGTTQDGSPRHPLYVRSTAPLIPWSPPTP